MKKSEGSSDIIRFFTNENLTHSENKIWITLRIHVTKNRLKVGMFPIIWVFKCILFYRESKSLKTYISLLDQLEQLIRENMQKVILNIYILY
jgi:hypothetical protein